MLKPDENDYLTFEVWKGDKNCVCKMVGVHAFIERGMVLTHQNLKPFAVNPKEKTYETQGYMIKKLVDTDKYIKYRNIYDEENHRLELVFREDLLKEYKVEKSKKAVKALEIARNTFSNDLDKSELLFSSIINIL
jgi:hypothetical protein